MVSMISTLENSAEIQVGMVGFEGFVGVSVLLGAPTSPLEKLVQVAGMALRLPATAFRSAPTDTPGLLLRYPDSFHVQVSQSATMLAGGMMIFVTGKRRTLSEGFHTVLHGIVPIIAACLYFAMASGQGLLTLPTHTAVATGGHSVRTLYQRP